VYAISPEGAVRCIVNVRDDRFTSAPPLTFSYDRRTHPMLEAARWTPLTAFEAEVIRGLSFGRHVHYSNMPQGVGATFDPVARIEGELPPWYVVGGRCRVRGDSLMTYTLFDAGRSQMAFRENAGPGRLFQCSAPGAIRLFEAVPGPWERPATEPLYAISWQRTPPPPDPPPANELLRVADEVTHVTRKIRVAFGVGDDEKEGVTLEAETVAPHPNSPFFKGAIVLNDKGYAYKVENVEVENGTPSAILMWDLDRSSLPHARPYSRRYPIPVPLTWAADMPVPAGLTEEDCSLFDELKTGQVLVDLDSRRILVVVGFLVTGDENRKTHFLIEEATKGPGESNPFQVASEPVRSRWVALGPHRKPPSRFDRLGEDL
jgi:hypothetical protein